MASIQLQGVKGLHIVVVQVTTKVGGVVRVQHDAQTALKHLPQVVFSQIREDTQLLVGQRAHRQGNTLFGQTRHQRLIVNGLHPMVDALGVKYIQGAPNIGRRAFFTRVGYQFEVELGRTLEHPFKLLGRMAALAGVQTHSDEFVSERKSLLEGFKSFVLGQMAQETQNQGRADAQLGLGVHTGAVQTGDDGAHRHFAIGMGLRVEKDFRMDHVVGFGA